MRHVLTPVLFVLTIATGCSTTPSRGLSSLGAEVDVQPLRGQSVEVLKQDDQACESWARSTKGPNEPLPAAELRYSACALSRGYSVKPWNHRISPSGSPDLESVVADMQACRVKAGLYDAGSLVLIGGIEAAMTEARREKALACLKDRGYTLDYQPDARAESLRKK